MGRRLGLAAAAAALLCAGTGCAPREAETHMDEGAIVYRPGEDARIHRPYSYPNVVRDDATGYELTRDSTWLSLPGRGEGLTLWRLDRRPAKRPPLYVVTRSWRRGSGPFAREGLEFVHAHEDGFFPYRDALYPADLKLDRVAGMIELHGREKGRKRLLYLDNRLAWRSDNVELERLHARSSFRPANFDRGPIAGPEDRVYLPQAGSAAWDPRTRTATAAGGSRLRTAHDGRWNIFLDVSGVRDRIYAEWIDPAGGPPAQIAMIPMRGWRDGYGETRTVQLITERHRRTGEAPGAAAPPGPILADLLNAALPIAGEHAGHLIVVDSRTRAQEWR